jgi:hypothetical protein
MIVKEAKHVDYGTIDDIMAEHGFTYWQAINFLIEYYKKEERVRMECANFQEPAIGCDDD